MLILLYYGNFDEDDMCLTRTMSCVAECSKQDGRDRGDCKDDFDGLVDSRVAFVIVV